MRIITLNVNGIRSAHSKGLGNWLTRGTPWDVVCLQEIKAAHDDVPPPLRSPRRAHAFFHPAERKGYSGVALYAKRAPRIVMGFGCDEFDCEGRYLEADFGEWTGAELKRLMKLPEWGTIQRVPSTFRFPGGESFGEMQHRIVSTLDRLRAHHPGGTVVCVSHADPIKAALAHALGTHLDLFQRIVVSPCSVSIVSWSPFGPVALTVNSTGVSLADLAPS